MTKPFRIAVVAPAGRFSIEAAAQAKALAAQRPGRPVELFIHPQCFQASGHFAGDDGARAEAIVEVGEDPEIDAVWFGRGGYGSNRVAETAVGRLTARGLSKPWLGYSDMGFLMAALFKAGASKVAHGPMVSDVLRPDGAVAVLRSLDWLVDGDTAGCEPEALEAPTMAFNLAVFSSLLGTPLEPDLTGRVLMLEDVSEYLYRIDRMMFHVTSQASLRRAAGLRIGRFSDLPENDPPFDQTVEEIARHWSAVSGVPYLGRADIGHDADNKVVPFW